MKKVLILSISLLCLFMLTGCGKYGKSEIMKDLNKKIKNTKAYYVEGEMEIINNEDSNLFEEDLNEYIDKNSIIIIQGYAYFLKSKYNPVINSNIYEILKYYNKGNNIIDIIGKPISYKYIDKTSRSDSFYLQKLQHRFEGKLFKSKDEDLLKSVIGIGGKMSNPDINQKAIDYMDRHGYKHMQLLFRDIVKGYLKGELSLDD